VHANRKALALPSPFPQPRSCDCIEQPRQKSNLRFFILSPRKRQDMVLRRNLRRSCSTSSVIRMRSYVQRRTLQKIRVRKPIEKSEFRAEFDGLLGRSLLALQIVLHNPIVRHNYHLRRCVQRPSQDSWGFGSPRDPSHRLFFKCVR
jgi:hypothetical protein